MTSLKKWKTISSKIVFKNKYLTVKYDLVKLPSGKVTEYVYTPSEIDSVIILALNNSGELLLQKEYSYPPNKIMWQLPGGSMEQGETIKSAALRELAEESGFSAKKCKKIGQFYVNNRKSNKIQHVLLCENIIPDNRQEDEDEFIESMWVSLENVHKMVSEGKFVNINLLACLNILFHYNNR